MAITDLAPRTAEDLVDEAIHDTKVTQRPARGHGQDLRGLSYLPVSRLRQGRFGRMFRLPPFVPDEELIDRIAALMTDPGRDEANDNPAIPAGYTYVGQFVDHDLTFDPVSSLTRQNDPDALVNFRTPRFDLDCLYGRGPNDDPFMYQADGDGHRERMLIDRHDDEDDLPRNSQGIALIGDPRNDENTFVSQFHLTMLKFHNRVHEWVKDHPEVRWGSETVFETAQRVVRWHYQWMVVHDFLDHIVGPDMRTSVIDDESGNPTVQRHFYTWHDNPYMPVEFSVAAYRFGHSMVRGAYKLNSFVPFLPIVDHDPAPTASFTGFKVLPPFWTIEWARLFRMPGADPGDVQVARKVDTRIAGPLHDLPPAIAAEMPSLVKRNLVRGARLCLPSGQDVARHMGIPVLSDDELGLPGSVPAPLWYYVLKESELRAGGEHLGDVGGRIVAEVFIGLMQEDPSSYLRNEPTFKPFLPRADAAAPAGDFTVEDLVTFAEHGLGVVTGPGDGEARNGGGGNGGGGKRGSRGRGSGNRGSGNRGGGSA